RRHTRFSRDWSSDVCSSDLIMSATGLSKGCIYGNFENKDDVALAAFDYNHNKVTEYIKEKILATENSIERLLVYPNTYRNYLKRSEERRVGKEIKSKTKSVH